MSFLTNQQQTPFQNRANHTLTSSSSLHLLLNCSARSTPAANCLIWSATAGKVNNCHLVGPLSWTTLNILVCIGKFCLKLLCQIHPNFLRQWPLKDSHFSKINNVFLFNWSRWNLCRANSALKGFSLRYWNFHLVSNVVWQWPIYGTCCNIIW